MDQSTASSQGTVDIDDELAIFYADLARANLHPLWQITKQLLPPTPRPRALPWLWPSSVLTPLAEEALRLVPVDRGGERRVLSLGNPGMPGSPYVAGTLWAAVQCLGPGETAPAHRHTPGAIRFVLEGTGVSTTVDGDACDMSPGDLVLTPAWGWHDHSSTGESRMLWFDGLDLPMIESLDAVFFEPHPEFRQAIDGAHNRSEREAPDGPRYVRGAVESALDVHHSPLLVYRRADTDAELTRLAAESDEAMTSLEFVNPATGASVLPTLSCGMHRLAARRSTPARRRTGNAVFVVYRGEGSSIIDGVRFNWRAGDMFVVPSWSAVEHHGGDEGADLFSLGDAPVLRALGIYREATLETAQEVRTTFDPATATATGARSMKLAIFDHPDAGRLRLGAVTGEGIVDVTAALPWAHDPDPLTAGWWRRLCRDHGAVAGRLGEAAASGPVLPLRAVALRAPVVGPSKILASASNYAEHVAEMHAVQQRTLGRVEGWMMDFDVFLKSPSAIVGPADDIVIPPAVAAAGHEVHHESELVIVVGAGGKDIPLAEAMDHVFGYTIGLDVTVRAEGDRSRRKSYDSFSPLGPWVTTADEAGDPATFDILLTCNGEPRQKVNTSSLITPVPAIVAYASQMMTLVPGDIIFTGAPPGVGPIVAGDVLDASISRLGSLHTTVR